MGVLGWHSYLQDNMISFESMEAKMKNAEIFKTIRERADKATEELAKIFGEPEVLKGYGRRNTTTMAVAPVAETQQQWLLLPRRQVLLFLVRYLKVLSLL
jgi:ribonucleoside-diphosphate reductase alpha chain